MRPALCSRTILPSVQIGWLRLRVSQLKILSLGSGIVRSQYVSHAELVLFISDYFLWAPTTVTTTRSDLRAVKYLFKLQCVSRTCRMCRHFVARPMLITSYPKNPIQWTMLQEFSSKVLLLAFPN